eukprot:TRINITY_DN45001_c0_g1_i2.p1 TRINITY_DN45001_c0_g1~~TRINITY_DN45001_c0_g1_i2.p1  ORF type:complete len:212 (-),score=26.05 TRINITY_DN45001_c0_g1_i2:246-881(-)
MGTVKPSQARMQALGVITFGALLYSCFDLEFESSGYMWITFNTCLFCGLVFLEKYAISSVDQTSTGISCYMNVLSLPVLLFGCVVGDEGLAIASFNGLTGPTKFIVLLSGGLGCLLSICYVTLNKLTTATAITIAGNLNKLLSSIVGALIFANKVTIHSVAGLLVCSAGGYLYSQAPATDEPAEAPGAESEELIKPVAIAIGPPARAPASS